MAPNSSNNILTITNNNYYTVTTTLIATISGSCYAPLFMTISAGSTTLSYTGTMNQGLCYGDETMTNVAMYTSGEPNFIWGYCPIVINIAPYNMQATLASGSPSEFSYSPGANPYSTGTLAFTLSGSPISVNFYQYTTAGCPSQTIWFMANGNSYDPNSFVVAPVPANGLITIAPNPRARPTAGSQSPESTKNRVISQIRVFDVLGRLRQIFTYGTSVIQAQVDVSKLETGVYFMEISSGQSREVKRILVQH